MQSQPFLRIVPAVARRLGLVFVLFAIQPVVTAGGGIEPLVSTRVAGDLNLPVYVTHAPGDYARLFIVEKPGRIKVLNLVTGQIGAQVFLDIDPLVGLGHHWADDPGLLGMAFHPEYASNGYFYVHYLDNNLDTVIQRFEVSSDPAVADPGSGMIVLTLDQPTPIHNGGWIDFGPDGFLYIALGDGGGQNDPDNRGQNLNDFHGKILRIEVDADDFPGDPCRNYAIPSANPFVGVEGEDEIWAYGLRVPWRCSFDRLTGDLYIADVGQNAWEEIDFQPAGSPGGENYGWRCFEGNNLFNPEGCPSARGMVFPIHEYEHTADGGVSIIGGYVYRGCAIPTLRGAYLFADFVTDHIWSLRYDGSTVSDLTLHDSELSTSIEGAPIDEIVSFGEDAVGEIYIVRQGFGSSNGGIFKVIPETPTISFADLDCDGIVGVVDFLILLGSWGACEGCRADIDGDGAVGIIDFLLLLANWG